MNIVKKSRQFTNHLSDHREREAAASRARALLPLTLALSARVIGHEGAPRALSRGE